MMERFTDLPQGAMTDIHWFSFDEEWYLLDVNSGNIFVIDASAVTALSALETAEGRFADAARTLTGEALESLSELAEMQESQLLFTADEYEGLYQPPIAQVKSLCLNISHDCNLRCRYCFAGTGNFGGQRLNMPLEVAKGAIDYLLEHSGKRKFLEMDFFGGEPLMNWPVVQEAVRYGKSRKEDTGKEIRFTLTTNAVSLTEEISRWLLEYGVNIVLSHDGRKPIHDGMRVFPGGGGSHDLITDNITRHIALEPSQNYYVRGTYSSRNLDFVEDIRHWLDLGWRRLSMEPVVEKDASWKLTPEDLPALDREYLKLVHLYQQKIDEGDPFDFFHFNLDVEHGPCLPKRLTGCGAGYEYMVVTPEGDLYPCHQFVGRDGYRLGSLNEGVINNALVEKFRGTHVYSKEKCRKCWARFYCSGGCHANAELFNGDIAIPYDFGCQLAKLRTQYALGLSVRQLLRQNQNANQE